MSHTSVHDKGAGERPDGYHTTAILGLTRDPRDLGHPRLRAAITQPSLAQPIDAESSHFLSRAVAWGASSSTIQLSQIPYAILWMPLSSSVQAFLPLMCQILPWPPCSLCPNLAPRAFAGPNHAPSTPHPLFSTLPSDSGSVNHPHSDGSRLIMVSWGSIR